MKVEFNNIGSQAQQQGAISTSNLLLSNDEQKQRVPCGNILVAGNMHHPLKKASSLYPSLQKEEWQSPSQPTNRKSFSADSSPAPETNPEKSSFSASSSPGESFSVAGGYQQNSNNSSGRRNDPSSFMVDGGVSRKIASSASTSVDTFSCLQLASEATTIKPSSSFSPERPTNQALPLKQQQQVEQHQEQAFNRTPECATTSLRSSVGSTREAEKATIPRTTPSPFSQPPAWLPPVSSKSVPPGASKSSPSPRKMASLPPRQPSRRALLQRSNSSARSFANSSTTSYATGDELVSSVDDDFSASFLEEEEDEDDSTTGGGDYASIATDPNVIAIGILAPEPPSLEPVTTISSRDRDKLSEVVANDIAEKEHNLKMRAMSSTTGAVIERRLSSPCLADRSLAQAKRNATRFSSFTTRLEPRRSFLDSLHATPSLLEEPDEIAMDLPPSKPSSTRSMDSSDGCDNMSLASSTIVITPRMRGRKSSILSNTSGGLNALDRQEKVRAARASMMGGEVRLSRPPKSHSLGSCSPPPIPVRQNSNNRIISSDDVSESGQTESAETAKVPSSACSVATNSSGIDLDEKTRNNIIRRSSSMHIARRQSSLLSDEKKAPSSLPLLRSRLSGSSFDEGEEDLLIERAASAVTGSRPSDEKNAARISRLSMSEATPQSRNRGRPSDEKAAFRQSSGQAVGRNASSSSQDKLQSLELRRAVSAEVKAANTEAVEDYGDLPFQAVMTSDIPSDDDEDHPRDLEAQAGVPVILPGAFAVRPISATRDQNGQPSSGYDSGFEENSVASGDENPQAPDVASPSGEDEPEQRPAFRPVVSSAPVEAELYEIDYADAQVLDPAEAEKAIRKRVRLLQAFLIILCLSIVTGITMAVLYSGDGHDRGCGESACIPTIRGWHQLGELLTGPTDTDSIQYGYSVAISGDGFRVAIGLPGLEENIDGLASKVGGVFVMDYNGTHWTTIAELMGLIADGNAGTAVAISDDGKRVVYGAPGTNTGGYVAMYEENADGSWDMVGNILGGFNGTTSFGSSLALSSDGHVVAIGDKYADLTETMTDVGTIRAFRETNHTWSQMGQVINGNEANDLLGWSVAISDDGLRVAASAIGAGGLRGEVRVFDIQDDAWVQVGQNLTGETDRETFGASIALGRNGTVIAIGATGYSKKRSSAGRVLAYSLDSTSQTWNVLGEPIDGDNSFDRFGSAVALSDEGDILVIGSPQNDAFGSNAGFAKVMQYGTTGWVQLGSKLGRSDSEGGLYGSTVAVSSDGSRFVAGAPELTYDGKLSKVGRVWVYERMEIE